MSLSTLVRRSAAAAALTLAAVTGGTVIAPAAQAAECTDIHVVFARGTGEPQGLGITGSPLVSGIRSNAPGRSVSSYAVVYGAASNQSTAGQGATDMTNHVVQYAADCPSAKIVLGGYSQGASVTDIAIGIRTVLGTGRVIPSTLASRVSAVVVFGNPLRLQGQSINTASPLYGQKALDDCNAGDPVCGGGFNFFAHITYAFDGSVTAAARFAAQRSL